MSHPTCHTALKWMCYLQVILNEWVRFVTVLFRILEKNIIERERARKIGWLMWRNILFKHARVNLLFYSSNLNASMCRRMMVIICVYTIFLTFLDRFLFYWSLSCLLLNTSAMYIYLVMTLIRVDSIIWMTEGRRIDYISYCL